MEPTIASVASPSDTEPDLVTWESIQGFPSNGDFARLIPTSRLAKERFSRLVSRLERDPCLLPHARRMIHYEPTTPEDESATEGSFAAAENGDSCRAFCGFYRLNMSLSPGSMSLGWVLGGGRSDLPSKAVDLVLTPTSGTDGVHGRHCRLKRDLGTGVLMLISDGRKVVVDGKYELKRDRDNNKQPPQKYQRALLGRTGLTIGDLGYVLEFTGLRQSIQEEELAKARGLRSSPALFMSPTPANHLYSFFGYAVKPASYYGASSTVSYGLSESTGQPVVLKKVKRTSNTFRMLEDEIKILRALSHENIYKLIEVIDHSNRRDHRDYKHGECDEVTLVLAPPAPTTLAGVIQTWKQIAESSTTFLARCVQQVASGLAYMHSQGVIHHDIKPDNIALVSMSPPKVVIIDLGHSEVKRRSNNHFLGTIRYLAPEVMRVKDGADEHFSYSVDVWALGITLFELLTERRVVCNLGARENRAKLDGYFCRHQDAEYSTFWSLAQRMTAWDSSRRVTAAEVEIQLKDQFPEPSQVVEDLTPTPTKRQKHSNVTTTTKQRCSDGG